MQKKLESHIKRVDCQKWVNRIIEILQDILLRIVENQNNFLFPLNRFGWYSQRVRLNLIVWVNYVKQKRLNKPWTLFKSQSPNFFFLLHSFVWKMIFGDMSLPLMTRKQASNNNSNKR